MGFGIEIPSLAPVDGGSLPAPTIPDAVTDIIGNMEVLIQAPNSEKTKAVFILQLPEYYGEESTQYFFGWVGKTNHVWAITRISIFSQKWISFMRGSNVYTRFSYRGTIRAEFPKGARDNAVIPGYYIIPA